MLCTILSTLFYKIMQFNYLRLIIFYLIYLFIIKSTDQTNEQILSYNWNTSSGTAEISINSEIHTINNTGSIVEAFITQYLVKIHMERNEVANFYAFNFSINWLGFLQLQTNESSVGKYIHNIWHAGERTNNINFTIDLESATCHAAILRINFTDFVYETTLLVPDFGM